MTANEARIAELVTTPPLVRSRRAKVYEWVRNVSLGVAYVALALGVWTSSQQGSQNHSAQVNSCVESNRVRAQVADLWQYIIAETQKQNPHPSAQQSADLAAFKKRVTDTYAPRKC